MNQRLPDAIVERPVRWLRLQINGRGHDVDAAPTARLSDVLRDDLGLTGTKIGCHAGDCGACTVLLGGEQVCACLVAVGQCDGRPVTTVEGLAGPGGELSPLQRAFVAHGAAQCGICTPGMLMSAESLLRQNARPTESQVQDALAGVLCRCTGYRKIVEAVLSVGAERGGRAASRAPDAGVDAGTRADAEACDAHGAHGAHGAGSAAAETVVTSVASPPAGHAVGARLPRFDAPAKVGGTEAFGADRWPTPVPADTLTLRVVRSPHAHARFTLGDLGAFRSRWPGIVDVITAADVPHNAFGVFAELRDQPVLADGEVRFRGEAVLGLVGAAAAVAAVPDAAVPIDYAVLPAFEDVASALDAAERGERLHAGFADNVLCRGRVVRGDAEAGLAASALVATASFTTAYVEHAYIEPEAGWAEWRDDDAEGGALPRLHVWACTQTPYMDRDELAHVLGLEPAQVHVVPSAIGGGFGGKLDLSVQPLIAVAAMKCKRPMRLVYERPESMRASTKRHPARMSARAGCDGGGRLVAFDFEGDFNTGAYASWGPTVANRVPIHASGPYRVPHVRALTRAVFTHGSVAGAFRGFGVPQGALLGERLMDELAERAGIDALEFRYLNALRAGDTTPTGQVLAASVGLRACLDALRPAWHAARIAAAAFNADAGAGPHRRGVGIACMWYGIGNTVIANPSTMRGSLRCSTDTRDTEGAYLMLYNGAQEIGQGTATVMPQMFADAVGLPVAGVRQVIGDTDLTDDAGKSSASRQTFVSGNAARRAGEALRRQLLEALGVVEPAELALDGPWLRAGDAAVDLRTLPVDERGDLFVGRGHFDPPTVPLDDDGQGVPYATFGFAAQIAETLVDVELGTVQLLHIHAAHDVGRAINPTQVEGQVHGGIAQGIGLALMEEYVNGRTDNLHDYLIPTVGDVPPITVHLIEDPEPLGPWGAKGVGEPALVATAPAILSAIHDATGVRMNRVPVTPSRLRGAQLARAKEQAEVKP